MPKTIVDVGGVPLEANVRTGEEGKASKGTTWYCAVRPGAVSGTYERIDIGDLVKLAKDGKTLDTPNGRIPFQTILDAVDVGLAHNKAQAIKGPPSEAKQKRARAITESFIKACAKAGAKPAKEVVDQYYQDTLATLS